MKFAFNTLALRVIAFLTLALLPIGLIAVSQTKKLSDEVQARLDLSLLASSGFAAKEEQTFILRASGAAEVLAALLPPLRGNPEECYEYLSPLLDTSGRISFMGYVDENGDITCSSTQDPPNLFDNEIFQSMANNQRRAVYVDPIGRISKTSVIVAAHPVFIDGVYRGYAAVSVPHEELLRGPEAAIEQRPTDVLTFNREGTILTSDGGLDTAYKRVPAASDLSAYVGQTAQTFRGTDSEGTDRVYALVPIIPGSVYTLSIWDAGAQFVSATNFQVSASAFPIMMWLASLGVAYLALHQLVLRHIDRMRVNMSMFARDRTLEPERFRGNVPAEFRDMESDFETMAQSLLHDEALMEGAVREKNILLKEVHHRVKNNLQLISSIMNMHVRKAKSAETQFVLRRLQDRVLGLATIHRNLYMAKDLGQLDAGQLLDDVISQLMAVGAPPGSDIDLRKDISEIHLFPDQAVPLSLFVSEAVTNALKYIGKPEDSAPWIAITLHAAEDGGALLSISNSKGAALSREDTDEVESTGVGSKLLRSFSIQLGAETEIIETERSYTIEARFTVQDFSIEAQDY